ncbi:hypothetical protein [Photobacterium lutimaris]|nr:hypothetical protein [Photobacterium lutimaris]TDR72572.1 hypothetical protein DFP78_11348 [Photobacterium lutimaris]
MDMLTSETVGFSLNMDMLTSETVGFSLNMAMLPEGKLSDSA